MATDSHAAPVHTAGCVQEQDEDTGAVDAGPHTEPFQRQAVTPLSRGANRIIVQLEETPARLGPFIVCHERDYLQNLLSLSF